MVGSITKKSCKSWNQNTQPKILIAVFYLAEVID